MGKYNTATTAFTFMVLVGLGVSACSSDDSASSLTESADAADAPAGEMPQRSFDGELNTEAGQASDAVDASPTGGTIITGQALATTAGITVATSDIRRAVDDTLAAVQRNSASMFTADVDIGDERDDGSVDGSGYFVVKVPPADLDALINDLGATVGRLSGRTQDTTDVTDQLVDLDIRIGVERDVIARFRGLLNDATEFADIVEIERVISERTISLEQLLASQRNLDNRVELSTLTIQLRYEPTTIAEPVAADDSIDGIGDAWRAGWDVFVGALFTVGFVLAVAAPFLLAALLVAGVIWLISRRRRTVATPSPSAGVKADEALAEPTRRG